MLRAARTLLKQAGPRAWFGMNYSGLEFPVGSANYKVPTARDWDYFRRWGITEVRLAIAWENIQPVLGGALNQAFVNVVAQCFVEAAARNIRIILDLHNFGHYCAAAQWGSTVFYAGNAGNAAAGVSGFGDATLTTAAFADIWTRLVTEFRKYKSLIGYCIMNEPVNHVSPTNMLFAPNGLADSYGTQPWFASGGGTCAVLAPGTNPLGPNYGPAWNVTASGGNFTGWIQQPTLANVQHTIQCQARVPSGTVAWHLFLDSNGAKTATTSWQLFTFTSTPAAGVKTCGVTPATSGQTIQVANFQLNLGGTALTYVPIPTMAHWQAGIDAIRALDSARKIYISGYGYSNAYRLPWENWEIATLTGGNLVGEGHIYLDGSVAQGGGGGTYAGNYASYGHADDTAGAQMVAPLIAWAAATGMEAYLGEIGAPNTTADAMSWTSPLRKTLVALRVAGIRGAYWYYQGSSFLDAGKLNMADAANSNHQSPHLAAVVGIR